MVDRGWKKRLAVRLLTNATLIKYCEFYLKQTELRLGDLTPITGHMQQVQTHLVCTTIRAVYLVPLLLLLLHVQVGLEERGCPGRRHLVVLTYLVLHVDYGPGNRGHEGRSSEWLTGRRAKVGQQRPYFSKFCSLIFLT